MLGLRRYSGVQIDLFQGEIANFKCDLIIASSDLMVGGSFISSIQEKQPRHLVIEVAPAPLNDDKLADEIMGFIRSEISNDKKLVEFPKRISFVLSSGENHEIFQRALFEIFPEDN
jgi:hypothetical protein